MKLYYHPASTTCRPIMLFAAENAVNVDFELVDIFTGVQYKDEFLAINPSHMVPVLEDGDFRLTESWPSSSISPTRSIRPRIRSRFGNVRA